MGRFHWDTCDMNGLVPAALMLASMALASSAAISYFKQLRKDRADPVINPAWPSVIRPGTLHLPEPDPGDSTSLFYDPSTMKRFDFGAVATHFRHCDVITVNSPATQVLPEWIDGSR